MKIYYKSLLPVIFSFSIISLLFWGCNQSSEQNDDSEQNDALSKPDSTNTMVLEMEGEVFCIPSPIQTAFLIKKTGSNYNREMLNDPQNATTYSTKFQKALNLGVYGADLGYVTMYDQTQDAIMFLKSSQKLADDLGVAGAFSKDLMKRFERNLGNRDSLLVLVSDAYKASDVYLKNNDRADVGSLILAGGWLEALYFSINTAKINPNPEIVKRIGEQKNTLDNLIHLLQPYYNIEEVADLIGSLEDLFYEFDEVQYKYVYEKPTTDPDNKITKINSKSEVIITKEQLEAISTKVETIRSQIVG